MAEKGSSVSSEAPFFGLRLIGRRKQKRGQNAEIVVLDFHFMLMEEAFK